MSVIQSQTEVISSVSPFKNLGFCLWFTGLSASGKSTTAEKLTRRITESGRPVTLLDGDVIRTHLSKELGFSREDRNTNIHRIGFVASEIVRHGGIVICATISPYRAVRAEVRQMVGSNRFFEIYMDTPLTECQRRDPKGLYSKATRGELQGFTGIDDPYEPPLSPELRLDTMQSSVEENIRLVLEFLAMQGFFHLPLTHATPRFKTSDLFEGEHA